MPKMKDLHGRRVHVHATTLHLDRDPEYRVHGIGLKFPGKENPVIKIAVTGFPVHHSEKTLQRLKFTGMLQALLRAKAMNFKNFVIKMQCREDKIIEEDPMYQRLKRKCDRLLEELESDVVLIPRRKRKNMTINECIATDAAEHSARLLYRTPQFPDIWDSKTRRKMIRKLPFLPGFGETVEFLEERLNWQIDSKTLDLYRQLGFPIKYESDDSTDSSEEESTSEYTSEEENEDVKKINGKRKYCEFTVPYADRVEVKRPRKFY